MENNYIFSFKAQAAFKRKFKTPISTYIDAFANDPLDYEAFQNLVWVCSYHTHKGELAPDDIDIDNDKINKAINDVFDAINDSIKARLDKKSEEKKPDGTM